MFLARQRGESHPRPLLGNWAEGRGRFELEVVNVDSSPALIERYGMRVPLLLAGDGEICVFRFRPRHAAAALAAP